MKETKHGDISLLAKDNKLCHSEAVRDGSSFTQAAADDAMRFHRSLPGYSGSELVSLDAAAAKYGVRGIYVKDESSRFGLNAFKGLGGSYAVFRTLCDRLGMDPKTAVFSDFLADGVREKCREITFVTATDGNHGKGVAWAARLFGCSSHVYMPAGSVEIRRQAIEDAGAETVEITDLNYDKAVALANSMAETHGWILVQDTAWDGYEDIPSWIVQGYTTMAAEACDRLEEINGAGPTHVFLQAGVGAMAGGVAGYLLSRYKDVPPVITIAEPETVACVYKSARAGDGAIHPVEGDPVTIMAGLNCGTPCSITWPVLRDGAACYCACSDKITEEGMYAYAHPEGSDPAIVSGESGAVTYGLLLRILGDEALRDELGMDEDSVILLFSTEGDTDPDNYRKIVYGG